MHLVLVNKILFFLFFFLFHHFLTFVFFTLVDNLVAHHSVLVAHHSVLVTHHLLMLVFFFVIFLVLSFIVFVIFFLVLLVPGLSHGLDILLFGHLAATVLIVVFVHFSHNLRVLSFHTFVVLSGVV
jgi:hypothetical protein